MSEGADQPKLSLEALLGVEEAAAGSEQAAQERTSPHSVEGKAWEADDAGAGEDWFSHASGADM